MSKIVGKYAHKPFIAEEKSKATLKKMNGQKHVIDINDVGETIPSVEDQDQPPLTHTENPTPTEKGRKTMAKKMDNFVVNENDIENQFDIESNENEKSSSDVNENEELNRTFNENEKTSSDVNENEELNQTVNENEKTSSDVFNFPFDIDDLGNWDRIGHINMTNFIVERGPKRVIKEEFTRDAFGRNFSSWHYIRELPNGEKQDMKWLIYSVSLDKVFCFCCKLFATKKHLVGFLAEGGFNDWHNISERLKSHERSTQHIESIASWVELEK
ncbi:uncharacterized protein LOC133815238 [Humulus lupulus]|uniref:uncharacterized protein LOC133815238 n=1 Tax=Humulus lupulus TaxID=3486 RepID=UPI002B40F142|nr:uncharacterized protein LOC133815238 [Humulus lupulus]